MKKYRPYTKFPDDIVGKAVHDSIGSLNLVTKLSNDGNYIYTTATRYSALIAFENLTYLDGAPVGEEYEEVVELEFDEVYLVRNFDRYEWTPRHFFGRRGNCYLFFDGGMSSKTASSHNNVTSWLQVCEYSRNMASTPNTPAEYLINKR